MEKNSVDTRACPHEEGECRRKEKTTLYYLILYIVIGDIIYSISLVLECHLFSSNINISKSEYMEGTRL